MATTATTSSAPIHRISAAGVNASIFTKEIETKSGKKATLYNVSLSRGYNDESGKRQYTASLREEDLLPGAFALEKPSSSLPQVSKDNSSAGPEASLRGISLCVSDATAVHRLPAP